MLLDGGAPLPFPFVEGLLFCGAPDGVLVDDVVDFAGAEPFPGDCDCAARAGEIATRPTMPAANGNRNLWCMAASSHLYNVR